MKGIMLGLGAVALAAALAAGPASADAAKAPDGKPIFTKYKCGSCHSIESQGIVKKGEDAPAEGAAAARKPPDLSSVGKDRKAEWIVAYMKKKEANEGRKHLKMFRGTDAELTTLASWLGTLKADKPAKGDKEKAGK